MAIDSLKRMLAEIAAMKSWNCSARRPQTTQPVLARAGYGNVRLLPTREITPICANCLVEPRGFEPMAIGVQNARVDGGVASSPSTAGTPWI